MHEPFFFSIGHVKSAVAEYDEKKRGKKKARGQLLMDIAFSLAGNWLNDYCELSLHLGKNKTH